MDIQKVKRAAAEKAVAYIKENMIVGLGSGSTAYYAIELLGQKIAAGLKIQGVPTSLETEKLAKENNIPLLFDFERVEITIDGADEVDEYGNLIKGGGGALAREKIVAAASFKEIIVVDESKLVKTLGRFPLPVEVLPFGRQFVKERLESLGCETILRKKGDKKFITDNQNYIFDCIFEQIDNPDELTKEINSIPGVVENGLFVGLTNLVIVGHADGSAEEITFNN